jgi:hypothetical protein
VQDPVLDDLQNRPWGNALQAINDMSIAAHQGFKRDPKAPGDLFEGITGLGFVFEDIGSRRDLGGAEPSLGSSL